jgi:hypothetical protein
MPDTIIPETLHESERCDHCFLQVSCGSTLDDLFLCPSCLSRCAVCSFCENAAPRVWNTVGDDTICRSCIRLYGYELCGGCHDYARGLTDTAYGDSRVCRSCAINDYWSCDGCGVLIDEDDYCTDCAESANENPGGIFDYSYKPAPIFHGDGPLYLGAELEITVPWRRTADCVGIAYRHLGSLGYVKEDSSIGCGFEIVTHPMTHEWATENFPWRMLDDLEQVGCDGENNGLHIHLSRAGFSSPGHIFRWMKLLHRNAEAVQRIARRSCEEWAAFTTHDRVNAKHYAKGATGARYRAINTQNRDTFELRVFASSLNRQEVAAAFALAAASVEYTRDLQVTDLLTRDGWGWAAFLDWSTHHAGYAALTQEWQELACAC